MCDSHCWRGGQRGSVSVFSKCAWFYIVARAVARCRGLCARLLSLPHWFPFLWLFQRMLRRAKHSACPATLSCLLCLGLQCTRASQFIRPLSSPEANLGRMRTAYRHWVKRMVDLPAWQHLLGIFIRASTPIYEPWLCCWAPNRCAGPITRARRQGHGYE
jgi:hypothetical protein